MDLTIFIGKITEQNTAIQLAVIFIAADILTGLLKAWKNKNLNSSVGRDGFIKKLGWIAGLCLGVAINYVTKINTFLILTATVCMTTELISILENLNDIGINLGCVKKYLDKVKDKENKE